MSLRSAPAMQRPVTCDNFRLTIHIGAKFDSCSKSGALTKMSLSSDIAQGSAKRASGGPAMLPPGSVCCGPNAACDYYSNPERGNQYMETVPGDTSPSPGA